MDCRAQCSGDRVFVAIKRPAYQDDGMGGRTRTFTEFATVPAGVKVGAGRDQETGRVLQEQQTATLEMTRFVDVRHLDRMVIGGAEFEVTAVDPPAVKPTRRVHAQRVEHEAS